MELETSISFLSMLSAAVAAFVLGAVYYGPLFGKRWQSLNRLSDEDMAAGNKAMIYGIAFLLILVVAFAIAILICSPLVAEPSLAKGAEIGLKLSLFFVVTAFGVNYLFARKPISLWLIDCGYMVLMFVLMGAIIGS